MSQLYTISLVLHIVAASATGLAVLYAARTVIQQRVQQVHRVAKVVAIGAISAIITGAGLVLTTTNALSPLELCRNFSIYLSITAVAELSLYFTAKQSNTFPVSQVLATFVFATIVSGLSIVYII